MVSPEERAILGGYDQPADETSGSDDDDGSNIPDRSDDPNPFTPRDEGGDTDVPDRSNDPNPFTPRDEGVPSEDDIRDTIDEGGGGHGVGAGVGSGADAGTGPSTGSGGGADQSAPSPEDVVTQPDPSNGDDIRRTPPEGRGGPPDRGDPQDVMVRPPDQGIEETGATAGNTRFLYEDEGGSYRLTERDLARELERDFLAENPEFSPADVRVTRDGERFAVGLTAQGAAQQQIEAIDAVERQLETQVGRDVEPGRDFVVSPNATGFDVGTTESFAADQQQQYVRRQQQQAAELRPEQDVKRQLETAVGKQRARSLGISPSLLGAEGARLLADLERGQDFTTEVQWADGRLTVDAGLTPEYVEGLRREFATTAFEAETGVALNPETDIKLTESGATLSRSGEVNVMANAPEGYGDATIRDAGDLPVIGGAVDWWAEQFGREPYGVSDLPSDISLETETVSRRRAGPGPRQMVDRERVTDVNVQTFEEGTTVEGALSAASLEYSDIVGEIAKWNVENNPFARGAIGAAGVFGYDEEAETVIESAVRGGGELVNIPQLGLTVKEAGEAVPYTAEETVGGRFGVSYDPERVVKNSRGQSVSAPLTAEETGLAPRAAADVKSKAIDTYDYARENPFEFGGAAAGSLIASAAIMGGAGAISSRAGLASRSVIQPGEELLGYGGNYLTRRVAGARTAQRLFPNNEPLIFSEEAAIRGARRSVASARRGVGRLRAEVEGTDVNVRPRPGIGLGGFAIEVERAEETEQPAELGPDLDPFDVSDTRLYDPSRTFGEAEPIERFIDEPTGELPQDIEGGIGPRGEAGGFRGGTVQENWEAYLEEERTRAETGQETFMELEARRRAETAAVLTGQEVGGLALETPSLDRLGFEVESRQETETFSELFADLEFEAEQRAGYEIETEGESELFRELEGEAEAEFFREFETEAEQEQEQEVEAKILGGRERDRDPTADLGFDVDSDESVIERATGAGWFNVFATALAGGGLEERAAAKDDTPNILPGRTAGQADPDEDLAAGLEGVADLFFVGGSRDVKTGKDSGDSDDDPWGLTF